MNGSGSGSCFISLLVEAEAEAEAASFHWMWKRKRLTKKKSLLEAEAEAIEKKISIFKWKRKRLKNFWLKWKRKRKLWKFFLQNWSGSGSAIKIYRFQNTAHSFAFHPREVADKPKRHQHQSSQRVARIWCQESPPRLYQALLLETLEDQWIWKLYL